MKRPLCFTIKSIDYHYYGCMPTYKSLAVSWVTCLSPYSTGYLARGHLLSTAVMRTSPLSLPGSLCQVLHSLTQSMPSNWLNIMVIPAALLMVAITRAMFPMCHIIGSNTSECDPKYKYSGSLPDEGKGQEKYHILLKSSIIGKSRKLLFSFDSCYFNSRGGWVYNFFIRLTAGGGWLYLYSFICLSAGAVEWESSCFVTTLLHHAHPKVTSVLVLFVIFRGLF